MNGYDSPPFKNRSRNRSNGIALVLMSLGVFIIIAILKGIVEGARHRWIWENYRGYIAIVLGAIVVWIIYSVITSYFSRHRPAANTSDRHQPDSEYFHDERAPDPAMQWQKSLLEHDELFESYVARRLIADGYKITAWRGDKRLDIKHTSPILEPDLLAENEKHQFAIECKWRNHYHSSGIEWARTDQWQDYRSFSKKKDLPVFVVIGIGGKPAVPDEVYVVPLDKINAIRLSHEFLKKYQKKLGKLIVNVHRQHYD